MDKMIRFVNSSKSSLAFDYFICHAVDKAITNIYKRKKISVAEAFTKKTSREFYPFKRWQGSLRANSNHCGFNETVHASLIF